MLHTSTKFIFITNCLVNSFDKQHDLYGFYAYYILTYSIIYRITVIALYTKFFS